MPESLLGTFLDAKGKGDMRCEWDVPSSRRRRELFFEGRRERQTTRMVLRSTPSDRPGQIASRSENCAARVASPVTE